MGRGCVGGGVAGRVGGRLGGRTWWELERRVMGLGAEPHRGARTLEGMGEAVGADRLAAVCGELTKTDEEVKRGGVAFQHPEQIPARLDEIRADLEGFRMRIDPPRIADVASEYLRVMGLTS